MENFRQWDFDVFALKNIAAEMTLPYVMMRIYYDLDIQNSLNISESVFANYVYRYIYTISNL